jgi:hypothetical protein
MNVKSKIEAPPEIAKLFLLSIRELMHAIAKEENLGTVTESLKWGEPSFQTKKGSPVRMDWKPKSPATISVYFNCKTRLIETFKEVYPDAFEYVGNREIKIPLSEPLPEAELKACLSMALRYHSIKHLPLLGC